MPQKPTVNSRKIQAQRTEKRIRTAAYALMSKKGFHYTSIADICAKSKISVGTFYYYFRSKDDLFFDLFGDIAAYFKDNVAGLLADDDPIENIFTYFRHYAEFNYRRDFATVRQLYRTQFKYFDDTGDYMFELLDEIIACGQRQGKLIDTMTVQEIRNCLFRVSQGTIYDWCLRENAYDLVEMMRFDISLVCQAIKK